MDFAIVEERIKQSMLILDNDFQEITTTKDQRMQGSILARMVTRQREVDAILAEQNKLLTGLLRIPKAMGDDERVARLLAAFEFGNWLADFVYTEMGDAKFRNKILWKMVKISHALDAIPPGRRFALATFLDNPNAAVRATAASYLKDLMPDRALSVLRAVHESERGTNAGMTAMTSIFAYELEQKEAARLSQQHGQSD